MTLRATALLLILAPPAASAQAMTFTPAAILAWRPHSFVGETRYRLVETDEGPAVEAVCADSASGLFLEAPIDLARTPILEWRWRVDDGLPPGPDETTKAGDDYAARLYAVRRATLPWRTRAVNYVWASAQAEGAEWPNAYAAQASMVAVRSGGATEWRTERRDLRADFLRLHGETVDQIDALAIMTDCDDRGGTARALYGTVRLLPE